MSSTNKLYSRLRTYIAKFLLSFCGIASFGVVGMFALTLLSFTTIFGANDASATSATGSTSNSVSVDISSSVAIRLLDSTASTDITRLDFDLTPTASGVTTTKRTVVDVATSNPTGYKLYMQSNYQDHSGNYTTNLVHSYTDVSDTIPTSINSGDKVYWNYVNPLTSTINTIPAHGSPERIAQNLEQTNSDQTPVDINVSVDTSIVSGTYTNQLLFSAVGNTSPLPYTLYFTPGTGTMAGTTIEERAAASIHTITIPSTAEYIPTGTNGLFTYWEIQDPTTASCSRNSNNTTNGNNNNNNNDTSICYPGDNITIDATIDSQGEIAGKATLIAHYVSISTMQAMAPNICTVAYTGASTTLTDTRDNKTYTIRKLKDNNCWMTQNLNYLPTNGTTLSLASSNVALSTTLQTSNSSKGNYLTDNCSTGNVDKYCTYYDSSYPEYGTYYNWYASTAGTGTSDLVSANATSSICPKGWRLPTGGPGGEFGILYSFYDSYDNMTTNTAGPEFMLSGLRNSASMYDQSIGGYYWSSTAYSDAPYTYGLYLDSSGVINLAGLNNRKQNGFTLRCLAHDNSYSILGVNPNGGTWNGSTSSQTFTQAPESTQTISNPTATPTYSITYNANGQGATYTGSPTSVARPFTGWALSGAGSLAGNTYTYGAGNGTLTAQYSGTSSSFQLPAISKTGYTCYWASNTTGTKYGNGGDSKTITGNLTIYAYCTANAKTIANSTYLQEVTSCPSTLTTGAQYSLKDQGETSKSYNTSKLADGKCWMTTNYNRSAGALSSTYYNVSSSGYTIPTSNCTKNGFAGYCNDSTYGGYYNWATATAGSNSTTYSICPKGWRLPTQAEFNTLITSYSAASAGSKLTQSPVNMKYGGVCGPGIFACGFNAGSSGVYWSSAVSGSNSYVLVFGSSSAYTDAYYRSYGYSVRCVFGS